MPSCSRTTGSESHHSHHLSPRLGSGGVSGGWWVSGTSGGARFAAVDVHYPPTGGARPPRVVTADPRFGEGVAEHLVFLARVAPYRPGEVFVRALPAPRPLPVHPGPPDPLLVDGQLDP